MKAIQLYNICWNNILQKLFCKLFAFSAKLLAIAISLPPPPNFLGAFSTLGKRTWDLTHDLFSKTWDLTWNLSQETWGLLETWGEGLTDKSECHWMKDMIMICK